MAAAVYSPSDSVLLSGHPWVYMTAPVPLGFSWKIARAAAPGVTAVELGPFSDREAALAAAKQVEEAEENARAFKRKMMIGAGVVGTLGVAAVGYYAMRSRSRSETEVPLLDTVTYQETLWSLDPRAWFSRHNRLFTKSLDFPYGSPQRIATVRDDASAARREVEREYSEGIRKLDQIHATNMKAIAMGKNDVLRGIDDFERNML